MIAILPIFFGFIMEYMTSPAFGFYVFPAAILSAIFYFLPFVFKWLNITIAFFAAYFFLLLYALLLAGWHTASAGFLYHAFFYLTIIAGLTYLSYAF